MDWYLRLDWESIKAKYTDDFLSDVTWLKNKAKWASSTAWSTSASSHTMNGDLPPSSRVTGLRLLFEANPRIIFPTSVDPVKATCRVQRIMLENYWYIFNLLLSHLYSCSSFSKKLGKALWEQDIQQLQKCKITRMKFPKVCVLNLINVHVTSYGCTSGSTKSRNYIYNSFGKSSLSHIYISHIQGDTICMVLNSSKSVYSTVYLVEQSSNKESR